MLIHSTIPITLHDNLLTFRHTGKVFELKEDLLKIITHKKFIFEPTSLTANKIMYDFATEMHFDEKRHGRKSTRDRSLIKLLKSTANMASGISNTKFLPSDPAELCDRLTLLLQEKHAGKNPNKINDEIVAIVDKFLEYKCISKKQQKQTLIKCNLLHK